MPEELRELLDSRLSLAEGRDDNELAFTLMMKGVNLLGARGELLSYNYVLGLNAVGFTYKKLAKMRRNLEEIL